MLLHRFPIRSFAEARLVDGTAYGTYQEAARARGLVTDQNEYFEALEEAHTFLTAHGMRALFVSMMVAQGIGSIPSRLIWDEMRDEFSEDFLHRRPGDPEAAYNSALVHISRLLSQHGRLLADEGLPPCLDDTTEMAREESRWDHQAQQTFVHAWTPRLTTEQRVVVDSVLLHFPERERIEWPGSLGTDHDSSTASALQQQLNLGDPILYFLDAPGGSGKTLLLQFLAAHLRSFNHVVVCTASTGIAAHSMYKLPFDAFDPKGVCALSMKSERAALLRRTRLFIYDEISMVQRNAFSSFLRLLADLKSPFQQIVITSGDYRQFPPVVKWGGKWDVLKASVKFGPEFSTAIPLRLTRNLRAREDPEYSALVQAVGNGVAPTLRLPDVEGVLTPLPLIPTVPDLRGLIRFVYPNLLLPYECARRAILAGTNVAIDDINATILAQLPGEAVTLLSADRCEGEGHAALNVSPEVLASFNDVGVPPHCLKLKVGAVAMIMRNLSFDSRLCNSTKVIIREICESRRLIKVEVPSGNGGPGPILPIPRIQFSFQAGRRGMFVVRRQFPIRPAFAMTFNKAQGQTLDRVGLDLRNSVFAHGQLYVAISRVRRRGDIRVLVEASQVVDTVPYTPNIVYPELIRGVGNGAVPAPDHRPPVPASEVLDASIEY